MTRLQKIPFDGAGRLSAEYLHAAFLGYHPLLQVELLGGCRQATAVLDRTIPIPATPAVRVVEFHAAAGRIAFGDFDGAARGGCGGRADGRYEHAVRLAHPVVPDATRRIAGWHLRKRGGREGG